MGGGLETEGGKDAGPDGGAGRLDLAVGVIGPISPHAQFATPADLTGQIQRGAEIVVGITSRETGGRSVAEAAIELGHDVETGKADIGAGVGLGASKLDGKLLEVGAVIQVGRRLEGVVRQGEPHVDLGVSGNLGEAIGRDGPGSTGRQTLIAKVDFAEGDILAQPEGVGALQGVSVEEVGVNKCVDAQRVITYYQCAVGLLLCLTWQGN